MFHFMLDLAKNLLIVLRMTSDLSGEEITVLDDLLKNSLPTHSTLEDKTNLLNGLYGDLFFSGIMKETLYKVAESKSLTSKTYEYEYDYEGTLGVDLLFAHPYKLLVKV